MKMIRRRFVIGIFILCPVLLWACRDGKSDAVALNPNISFSAQGILMRFPSPAPVSSVTVSDADGRVILRQDYGSGFRKSCKLHFTWRHGMSYHIELNVTGKRHILTANAPIDPPLGASVNFQIPYDGHQATFTRKGLEKEETCLSSAAVGSIVTGGLVLKHYRSQTARYHAEIVFPPGVELIDAPPNGRVRQQSDTTILTVEKNMTAINELIYFVFRVKIRIQKEILCSARITQKDSAGETVFIRTVRLSGLRSYDIASRIRIEKIQMPTSPTGLFDTKRMPDVLFFSPELLRRLSQLLGIKQTPRNYWTPFTYQTVHLQNTGAEPLSVMLTSKITSRNSADVPVAFLPPDRFTGKLKDQSVAVTATIPGSSAVSVILPVFVNTVPHKGIYDRYIHVYPMGVDIPIYQTTRPLYVKTTDLIAVGTVLGSLLLSTAGILIFAAGFKKIMGTFSIQNIVVISFFGAMTFAGINVPLKIFNSVITAVFGPFSFLILGFFNDLIYFSILIALLRLIPRPGVVTLTYLVRYLLSGMMLGGFHILDFLYMGTALMLKEGALYAAGVTRLGEDFEWTFPKTLLTASLLSIADALINASSVYLHMIFYRLYFADWYIVLSILFNGLIYTSLGVFFGRRFSNTLKMVQE